MTTSIDTTAGRRPQALGLRHRLLASLAEDLDVGGVEQQGSETLADERVVVGDQAPAASRKPNMVD